MAFQRNRQTFGRDPGVVPRGYVPVPRFRHVAAYSQRTRVRNNDLKKGYSPPEDWHAEVLAHSPADIARAIGLD